MICLTNKRGTRIVTMADTLFETPQDREQEACRRAIDHAYDVLRCGYRGTQPSYRQTLLLRIVVDRVGLARAISISELAALLKTSPREIKADVRDLRLLFRIRIGSSRDGAAGGFYMISTKQELLDTVRPFARQAQAEFAVVRALCEPHELAELEGQLRLEER
jgi:hypothetical protein